MLRRFVSPIILILLATPILTFNIRPARCTIGPARYTTILSQNFDGEPTGSIPEGWTVQNPSICPLTINETVYHGISGKSARYADMASYPGGTAYVGRTFEDQHGSLVLSVAMMAEVPEAFMLYIDDGSVAHAANIYFMPDGYLKYFDGYWRSICPFSVNTWYQIKMEIDVPTNTYDIYVDGSLKVPGAHFRGFGQATYLNRIEFGGNSWEMPVGFIDDLSITTEEHIAPVTPVMRLAGSLDYLFAEDVKVRLDALVKDNNTMAPVSNASVTVQIYYPNGSLWVSDTMLERLAGTGIYEWESKGTIHEMNLEKGVYLAYAQASVGSVVSTDILLFHIDPSGTRPTPTTFQLYATLMIALVAGTITGTVFLRRHRKRFLKTSRIS